MYVAACARDARLTRICVASIRYFHPDVPIRLLAGDILQRGLAEELHRYWGVELVKLPAGDYGWGLVKLEPLFAPAGERFLMLDVDTVFTGAVLDYNAETNAPFLVDNEATTDAERIRLYYDWINLAPFDPNVQYPERPFNSGQWFATGGLLKREDFDPWVDWELPRKLKYPGLFMPGEMGVLNYVVLQKEAREGLRVERRELMRWPGHSMTGLDAASVASRKAPALVVHWAGMKDPRLGKMVGADLLLFFEDFYYSKRPARGLRRILDHCQHFYIQWMHALRVRAKLRYQMVMGNRVSEGAQPGA